MSSYPINLKLKGQKVVVVGGGVVATRKIKGLLEAEADVTVVSLTVTETIDLWVKERKVQWIHQAFEKQHLNNAFLIIAATNDKKVNQCVLEMANSNQLVSVVTDPVASTFHTPATIRKGKLLVTVSTEGASPSFAKHVKKELEKNIDDKYSIFLDFLANARQKIQSESLSETTRHALFREISSADMLQIPATQWEDVADRLLLYYKTLETKE